MIPFWVSPEAVSSPWMAFSMDIRAGEIFGLVGESGSGKTTASRLIVGLETPDEGRSSSTGRILSASTDGREGPLPSRFK
jgi:ABC-type glutathione transport system ATPase component